MVGILTSVIQVAVLLGAVSHVTVAGANDIETIYDRRVAAINGSVSASKTKIDGLLETLQPNGTWPTISYVSGCDSQRSSWPPIDHWNNVLAMAVAYKGKTEGYLEDQSLLAAIRLAMGFWFSNEMSTIGDGTCMDREYLEPNNCPCGTPGLWGANWASNVMHVPKRVGQTCNTLRSELSESELGNCTLITSRAFSTFYRDPYPTYLTGANVLDISVIGVDAGLLENNKTGNASRIADAYRVAQNEVSIHPGVRVDGIKPDGSFQHHSGVLFNGMGLFRQLVPCPRTHGTRNSIPGQWYRARRIRLPPRCVIGRYISYPVADSTRASAALQMNLDDVARLGRAWGQQDLIGFGTSLKEAANDTSVNSAKFTGNRVHRTNESVTTLKMLSNRTTTSRCTNSEGPYSFHLSDGVVYTFTTGAEYEDIFAALDYNAIPGITTDYNGTVLECATVGQNGIDPYAGGVQAGDVGMAAMRYINPLTNAFKFHKAWFFFPHNVQHVLVSSVEQTNTNSTSPVYSVLDQRLRSGEIYIDGYPVSESVNETEAEFLWHAGTGYRFPVSQGCSAVISVGLETRTGDWRKLGVSPTVATPKDIFTAWIPHEKHTFDLSPNATDSGPGKYIPAEYSVFLATESYEEFEDKASRLRPRTIANTETVSAAIDSSAKVLGAAFWKVDGGSFTVRDMGIRVEVDRNVIVMLEFDDESHTSGRASVADPTHGTGKVNIKVTSITYKRRHYPRVIGHHGERMPLMRRTETCTPSSDGFVLTLDLPEGNLAGSTVTKNFSRFA
ncbi:polysaccharide lyase family 8 protein [Rhizoctonia solani AG-1 IA]|uniref:Polysaccharide lyase family 8 protein n=1 Tax=Thanatephorus cucumeris (strain AG1-IA) TaxID=983506 RepID=L8WLF1_THACA|nr:polysaccharide lyase family 8 protein [Rhizoctonia solani AG-1 IA]